MGCPGLKIIYRKKGLFNGGLHFICFRLEIPFLDKLDPKNQNYQFKLKFETYSLIQIWTIPWCTFSVLERKHPFWVNLVQKIKIVSLSWNLVPRLIRTCRIQWWCAFFGFRPETPFLGKFGSNSQNCQFKLKFGTWTNSKMQNSMVLFTFSVLYQKHPFW